ncbi:hypothetical protein IEQ34_022082 [Dendrobium chrysotoxum]|uniref:Uncharacterized protein n=1 Tax=Dendrobium chrysotoxum TaxID=161865 RepID=A0AAV7FY16_DENCH|nr:hypothetical protein IEQ34_022082 [Dendrobium chrysotoxum]
MDPTEPRSSRRARRNSNRRITSTPKSSSDQVANLSGMMDRVTQFYKETKDWQFEMKILVEDFKLITSGRKPIYEGLTAYRLLGTYSISALDPYNILLVVACVTGLYYFYSWCIS